MVSKTTVRNWVRNFLGTASDDPAFTNAILDPHVEAARDNLVALIHEVNPDYLSTALILTGTGNTYNLAAQAADFARVREIRLLTAAGTELSEKPLADLNATAGNFYGLSGVDSAAVIYTSTALAAAGNLYLRYAHWPADWTTDGDAPPGIPVQFHDVVALEAIFAFALGGEEAVPEALEKRWVERKTALANHVKMRGGTGKSKATTALNRAGMRSLLRMMLGIDETDPTYTDARLNMALLHGHQSLLTDIEVHTPDFLWKTATLAVDSGETHKYTLSTQSAPITDFSGWLEMRYTDKDGSLLRECRADEMREAGGDYFSISSLDETAIITTSDDSPDSKALWLRYRYWPPDMDTDDDVPGGIPAKFRDVVALESLSVVAPNAPQNLYLRWIDRRGQLMAHIGRRGVAPGRTRLDQSESL